MANEQLSAMSAISAVLSTTLFYADDAGSDKKVTGAQLKSYMADGGTVATSTPIMSFTQTWDDGGAAGMSGTQKFTALSIDITATSADMTLYNSPFIEFKVGGTSKFKMGYGGSGAWFRAQTAFESVYIDGASGGSVIIGNNSAVSLYSGLQFVSLGFWYIRNGFTSQWGKDFIVGWQDNTDGAGGSTDLSISRAAANLIAFGKTSSSGSGASIKAATKAGAFANTDVVDGGWLVGRDTSGNTTKLYYNNGGTLMSVSLT